MPDIWPFIVLDRHYIPLISFFNYFIARFLSGFAMMSPDVLYKKPKIRFFSKGCKSIAAKGMREIGCADVR
ncbi:hypothetical protein P4S72_23010 [Vibrio sp. PP-XX7]